MSVAVQRGPLTDAVLVALRAGGFAVGDGEMPDESWIGAPNLPGSVFAPFAVCSELAADRSSGPIGASQGDWRMPYMVEYFAVRRDQCGALADRLRGALSAMRGAQLTLGGDTFKVQYVRTDNLGSPQRIDSVHPPFWHQQDGLTVWIGKEPSP